MPYEVSLRKRFTVLHPDGYINECCWGGDVVCERLLPAIRQKYQDVDTGPEDWGWFIWFRDGSTSLAVDVFCDDRETGEFRIHLTSRRKRLLVLNSIVDVPELDRMKDLVVGLLDSWADQPCGVEAVDERYRRRNAEG